MREPALERIADEIIFGGARKGFDQQVAGLGSIERHCWIPATRAPAPAARARHPASPASRARARQDRSRAETCRLHRPAPSDRSRSRARHRPRPRPAPRICRISPANTKVSPGVSVSMKYSSTSPSSRPPRGTDARRWRTRAHQPHLDHVGFDDGADIHAVALRDARMRDAPAAVFALPDLGEALVGLQRVAAGGDEIDRGVEIRARERAIRRGARTSAIKLIGEKRRADAHGRGYAARARRARRCAAAACPARSRRPHRSRRGIPAPRSGWPAPARLREGSSSR